MGSIRNSSGATTYSNYSSLSTNVSVDIATSITVTRGRNYSTNVVVIFCDWNNNGLFTDAGETVYTSPVGSGPFTASITPPVYAISGTVRMRIRLTDSNSGPNYTPCGTSSYGEVEDYSLVVGAHSPTPFGQTESGSFTVQGEKEGEYYLMDEAGKLILSFTLSADNKFIKTINGLGDGFYIVVGQNKYGVTKQRILVTK